MGKVNQIRAGTVLSYVQMAASTIVSLSYTPVMLRILGQSEYGLYSTVASTISVLSLLNLGFGGSYVRYFIKYQQENESTKIAKLNGLFFTVFSVIGLIALVCGLYLSNNLELIFKNGMTPEQYHTAKIMMILLTVNLAVGFPMSVFGNIISAHEQFVFQKLVTILNTVVSPLVTLPILLAGYGSVGMVAVTVAVSATSWLIQALFCIRRLKMKVIFREFEKGLLGEIAVFSGLIAVNMIVDQVNNNLDKLILTRYCGTERTAVYAIGQQLNGFYISFSTAVSGVFAPRVHQIVQRNQSEKAKLRVELTDIFTRVGRIQFLILALVCLGLVFFGKPFIRAWAGSGYTNAYYVVLLLCIPGIIPLIQNLGIEIQRAQFLHHYRSLIYGIMAIGNLVISIILCKIWGEIGCALGTALAVLLANGLIMNIVYHKKINIDMKVFWRSIIEMARGLVLPIAFGILLVHFFNFDHIVTLLVGIVAFTTVYSASMWKLSMNSYEKSLVKGMTGKLWKKA